MVGNLLKSAKLIILGLACAVIILLPCCKTAYAAPYVFEDYTQNTDTSNSLTLTKPSNVAIGDLLLILVGNESSISSAEWDNTTHKPTGFTLINESGNDSTDTHTGAFYRIADGSEGATINVPAQSSVNYWGFYIRVAGVDPTNPINAVGSDANTVDTSIVISGITRNTDECLAFYIHSFDGGDSTSFTEAGSGWVEKKEIRADTSGNGSSGSWGTKSQTYYGSTGEVTVSGTASDGWSRFQFAVTPSIGLADRTAGQEPDALEFLSSATEAKLFAFQLTNHTSGPLTVTKVQFQLPAITGIVYSDFANLKIVVDVDNDGFVDPGETTTEGGAGYVDEGETTITFDGTFNNISAGATVNCILTGDLSNLAGGDTLTIALEPSDITVSGTTVGGCAATSVKHTADSFGSYSYRKPITLQENQIPDTCGADLTNFPVLISISGDNDLKTAPTGHVQSSDGWDIIFKDANGNQLDHEVEEYNGTNQRRPVGLGADTHAGLQRQHADLHVLRGQRRQRCDRKPGGSMGFQLQGGLAPRGKFRALQGFHRKRLSRG